MKVMETNSVCVGGVMETNCVCVGSDIKPLLEVLPEEQV